MLIALDYSERAESDPNEQLADNHLHVQDTSGGPSYRDGRVDQPPALRYESHIDRTTATKLSSTASEMRTSSKNNMSGRGSFEAKPAVPSEGVLSTLKKSVVAANPSSAATFALTQEQATAAVVVGGIASAGVAVAIGTNVSNAISARKTAEASMVSAQAARTVAETGVRKLEFDMQESDTTRQNQQSHSSATDEDSGESDSPGPSDATHKRMPQPSTGPSQNALGELWRTQPFLRTISGRMGTDEESKNLARIKEHFKREKANKDAEKRKNVASVMAEWARQARNNTKEHELDMELREVRRGNTVETTQQRPNRVQILSHTAFVNLCAPLPGPGCVMVPPITINGQPEIDMDMGQIKTLFTQADELSEGNISPNTSVGTHPDSGYGTQDTENPQSSEECTSGYESLDNGLASPMSMYDLTPEEIIDPLALDSDYEECPEANTTLVLPSIGYNRSILGDDALGSRYAGNLHFDIPDSNWPIHHTGIESTVEDMSAVRIHPNGFGKDDASQAIISTEGTREGSTAKSQLADGESREDAAEEYQSTDEDAREHIAGAYCSPDEKAIEYNADHSQLLDEESQDEHLPNENLPPDHITTSDIPDTTGSSELKDLVTKPDTTTDMHKTDTPSQTRAITKPSHDETAVSTIMETVEVELGYIKEPQQLYEDALSNAQLMGSIAPCEPARNQEDTSEDDESLER